MYLFGSHLIKKHFPDFRSPQDIDWVTNDLDQMKESIVGKEEFYYIPFSPNREMTPDEIYTIKVSHAIYDIHWKKTMSDIRFLQIKGCEVIPEFLTKLRQHWVEVHGDKRRTDFKTIPDNFFSDKVKREIDHDELHVLLNPNPTYKKFVDGVDPNQEKFLKLADDDKVEALFEEAFVISLERFHNLPNRAAYHTAQQALVTRLHPIWISDIVIKNWNKYYWNSTKSKFYNNYNNLKNN